MTTDPGVEIELRDALLVEDLSIRCYLFDVVVASLDVVVVAAVAVVVAYSCPVVGQQQRP